MVARVFTFFAILSAQEPPSSHVMRKEGSRNKMPAQAAAADKPATSAKYKGEAARILAELVFYEKHLLCRQPGPRIAPAHPLTKTSELP